MPECCLSQISKTLCFTKDFRPTKLVRLPLLLPFAHATHWPRQAAAVGQGGVESGSGATEGQQKHPQMELPTARETAKRGRAGRALRKDACL